MALNLLSTGISFTDFAHSGGMATELLDDYETGTFQPVVMTGSWSVSNAGYIKIGRMCNFQGYGASYNSTFTSSGASANYSAPFTSSYSGNIGPFMCGKITVGSGTWCNAYMGASATTWYTHFFYNHATTGWASPLGSSHKTGASVYWGNSFITNA